MTTKECKRCNTIKPITEYYNKKDSKDGKHIYCNICSRVEKKEYYELTKEKRADYYKQHRIENKEYYNTYSNKHYHTKKELYREWNRNKYATDINFKLKHITSARIHEGLKRYQTKKQSRTIDYLGCSIEEYYIYLQQKFDKNMSWDNHGSYWEIDHIKPIDSFDLQDESQMYECFNFNNTQPMEKYKNRLKSNITE